MIQIRCAYTRMVPISELKAKFHPKNPNRHPTEQIERLAEIYKYQGVRKPAVLSKRSDLLTAGHGRILAAEVAGMDEYPVDMQDYDNDDQEYADLTADNAIALWADLDLSGINTNLPDLGPDFSLNSLGVKNFSLEPPSQWDKGTEAVEKTEENLDGIAAKIVIKCPQDLKDEVRIYVQRKLLETSFEGVTIE
jgi:hypothetical protein